MEVIDMSSPESAYDRFIDCDPDALRFLKIFPEGRAHKMLTSYFTAWLFAKRVSCGSDIEALPQVDGPNVLLMASRQADSVIKSFHSFLESLDADDEVAAKEHVGDMAASVHCFERALGLMHMLVGRGE